MPVFHQYHALFVHIPKNAGRSIEEVLLKESGTPDDGRRNLVSRAGTWLQRKSASPFTSRFLIGTYDVTLASQHLTFAEMQLLRLLPENVLQTYHRFCVCRNPFDRAVSTVMHFAKLDGLPSPETPAEFERLLATWFERRKSDHNLIAHDRSQADYVLDMRGQMAMNTVLRFETLDDDFTRLTAELGIPEVTLTWFGKSARSRQYTDYYTPAAREMVARKFAEDLELFSYRFNDQES